MSYTTNDGVRDVVVVGAGAAGLNAALVLARIGREVAIVDAGQPRNAPATHMHGFLSRDGVAPAALLAAGRAEVSGYGVQLIDGRVDRIEPGFDVHLDGGRRLRARRVLIATGLRDELPGIPGDRDRWGRDVLNCPYCHGHEFRGQPVGVLGTHAASVHQALLMRQLSDDVTYFPHTLGLSDDDRERLAAWGIPVVEGEVDRLAVRDDRLRGVELAGGDLVPRNAVFIFPRMVPHDALLTGLGCEKSANGWVIADASGRTSVPGVWAAGNVVNPQAQVVVAAGMGYAAGFAISNDLLNEDTGRAVSRYRDGSIQLRATG